MAVTLGGIEIPDIIWIDQYSNQQVAGASELTRGGYTVTWEAEFFERPVTLQGRNNTAFFDIETFEAVKAIIVPDHHYILEYNGETYTVRFRTEDPPAVAGTPVNPYRAYQQPGDKIYQIVIKLAIIGEV